MERISRPLLLATSVCLLLTGSVPGRAEEPASVAATVNGEAIPLSALVERLLADAGASLLEKLIQEKVVEQAAAAAGITVTEDEIDEQVAKVQDSLTGTETLEQMLDDQGMSMTTLREQIRMRLRLRKLVSGDLQVNDAELRHYYAAHPWMFEQKEQVKVAHIWHQNEAKLKLLKLRIAREGFDKVAEEVREEAAKLLEEGKTPDRGAATIGWISRERTTLETSFVDVAFRLQPNQVDGPVRTATGYHLIKVLDRKAAHKPTFDEIKAKVKETVYAQELQKRMGERMAQLLKAGNIQRLLTTAPSGSETPAAR